MSFGQITALKGSVWHRLTTTQTSTLSRVRPNKLTEGELYFTVDLTPLKQVLNSAPQKLATQSGVAIELPNRNGEMEKYTVWENSNMTPDFQAQFPEIRSYVGQGVSDKSARLSFSVSPLGIQTMVLRANGASEFIEAYDKAATAYVLFNETNRNSGKLSFKCGTRDVELANKISNKIVTENLSSNQSFKTMKLALSCTAEYSNYFGATSTSQVALVIAAMNATMTRVNGVMENDLAVHLNMIDNKNVIYYNASTDPYDPSNTGASGTWNAQLMNTLHAASFNAAGTGDSAFDIGHLFGKDGGGGNAGCIGCVCNSDMSVDSTGSPLNYKGSGFTSPGIDADTNAQGPPSGDTFDIDYVAHEMGHQLGATHTFTDSGEGNNAGTKCATYQNEPGSGVTIMGYAGITNVYNSSGVLQVVTDEANHSLPIYSYINIAQIQSNLAPLTCPVSTPMTDHVPVVNAGADYTIPKGTAFVLTGTATDADASDVLTYNWEESDTTTATYTATTIVTNSKTFATKTDGPLFRTFASASTPTRYFPQLSKTLAGTLAITKSSLSTEWESVYSGTANRNLNFTFIARDNHLNGGQTATDAMLITVDATKGPFAVTSQAASGLSYAAGSTQTVTWNTASTSTLTGASTVDIYLSTNVNGNSTTFPTLVASGVSNATGTASVVIPANTPASTTCRFMVKASGNIFFAVNSINFAITPSLSNETFGLNNFSLYPNPNKGNFSVQFDSTSTNDIEITVHDIRGRNIFERSYPNTGMFSQNLQLDNVQSGVYLVTVKDGDKKVVKKIVVE